MMMSYHVAILFSVFAFAAADAGIMLSNPTAYTQDFNSLAVTGTSSAIPTDWVFLEAGTAANSSYTAGTGSSATGNTYSFGSAGNLDRAFGELTSESLSSTIGASFTNQGSTAIQSLRFGYKGEQWRIGNNGTARTDRLDFQYSLTATSLASGAWINFDSLDFLSPITTAASVGTLDGNQAANSTNLVATLTGLNIEASDSIWIRWQSVDVSGSDDGLAIDDFSITADFAAVPEPSSIAFILTGGLVTAHYHKRRRRSGETT